MGWGSVTAEAKVVRALDRAAAARAAFLLNVFPLLRHFEWSHLPEDLAAVSLQFCELAYQMADALPEGPEATECLRKLMEAKDCAVRAKIEARPSRAEPQLAEVAEVIPDRGPRSPRPASLALGERCDMGGCSELATRWEWAEDLYEWLPACHKAHVA